MNPPAGKDLAGKVFYSEKSRINVKCALDSPHIGIKGIEALMAKSKPILPFQGKRPHEILSEKTGKKKKAASTEGWYYLEPEETFAFCIVPSLIDSSFGLVCATIIRIDNYNDSDIHAKERE